VTRTADPTTGAGSDAAPTLILSSRSDRLRHLLRLVAARVKQDNINVVAAGIAFWALLAIPAVLAATLSIYGLVSNPADVEGQIADGLNALPDDARSIVSDQLTSVAGSSGTGLALGAVVGLLLALWTTSGAVSKLLATLNTIWRVPETRGFVALRGLSVLLTLGAIAVVGGAAFVVTVVPTLVDELGLGRLAEVLLSVARVPALLGFMAVALALLYWLGPAVRRRRRWLTAGSVTATVLWVVGSFAFSVYTATLGSYNETYGALGGVVVLLLWLYLTAFVTLLGAEVDAALDDQRCAVLRGEVVVTPQ
jgi:membrane protein